MATGMKKWILITVGVSALVAVALLPPRSYGPESGLMIRPGQDTPEYREYREVQNRVTRIASLQKVAELMDSVVPALVSHDGDIYTPMDGVPADRQAGLLDRVESLRDRVPGAVPVKVGVVEVDLDTDAPYYGWAFTGHRYMIGEHDGVPYCLVVEARDRDRTALDHQDVQELANGPCQLYARYGMPGPGVRNWLRSTLHRFARWDREFPEAAGAPERRREIFGLRARRSGFLSMAAERCVAGQPEACMKEVLDPGVTMSEWSWWYSRYSDVWIQDQLGHDVSQFIAHRSPREGFDAVERSMVFHLEEEFGQEAFARFWRSDAPLVQAFEDAFGLPMGQWVMSWARRHHGTQNNGPAVSLSAAGLSILSVILLGAVAGLLARRRTLG